MASSRMPDEFFELVSHHLPPQPTVGPKGGRPPIPHRTVLKPTYSAFAEPFKRSKRLGWPWCSPANGLTATDPDGELHRARNRVKTWAGDSFARLRRLRNCASESPPGKPRTPKYRALCTLAQD